MRSPDRTDARGVSRVVELDAGVVERAAAKAAPREIRLDRGEDGAHRIRRVALGDVTVDQREDLARLAREVRADERVLGREQAVDRSSWSC